jgi:class 3 adenylate cyclase
VAEAAPITLREERKVVSALFADLVGSTALGERLDAEEVKLVVGEAVARIVREVEEFGGHVKDLAGDGVLAFFGAPVAYEDDAERAVRAALRIVEEIGAYAREVERAWGVEGFGVRVGVGTGPVVLGALGAGSRVEYAAFGDTVNRAARLQGAAAAGGVLMDEPTSRAVQGVFETGDPLSLELKGITAPVTAMTVVRARGVAARRRGVAAQLVGRDAELQRAGEWVDRLRAGTGGALVLSGEAGIGKSRLLVELHHRFADEPLEGGEPLWLEGRCVSYGESLPLWPIRDLLRDWLGVSFDEPELRVRVLLRRRVEALFGERAAEVYPYLGSVLGVTLEPEAAARLAQLSPEALQYRTFEVVGALLGRLAEDGPVVAAIEDVHWTDPTSVQLVERLLPLTEEAAVLLVLTQRSERDHVSWALKELAALEYPHLFREIALEPLSGDAERELLESLTGADTLPADLAARILDRAEGNPFFLEELVRSLADAGARDIIGAIAAGWEDVFGSRVAARSWSWRAEEAMGVGGRLDRAYLRVTGWFPGYADPEYYLRLLFHSDSRTNEGGFRSEAFDDLIERARRQRDGRTRLELFHEADRMAVAEEVACIPLVYGRNVAYVKPWVHGWWEFGKSSSSFADLVVGSESPGA